jgi:DUF1009 family protein
MSPTRLALIAGAGRFPFHIAQEARRQGIEVHAFGIKGWADAGLAQHVAAYEELPIGQLGRFIERLKASGARQAVMAGKVTKDVLLSQQQEFDAELRAIVQRAKDFSAPALLGAIGDRLAREQITLMDSAALLTSSLCPPGVLTQRGPSASEQADIAAGFPAARALAALDAGQTVVVKGQVVIAVEAIEGTDAAVRRARDLAGDRLVVVKAAAPRQDRRFDLPVIGPATIKTLTEVGATCLAVEAGATVILDRDLTLDAANAAGICLTGVVPPPAAKQ